MRQATGKIKEHNNRLENRHSNKNPTCRASLETKTGKSVVHTNVHKTNEKKQTIGRREPQVYASERHVTAAQEKSAVNSKQASGHHTKTGIQKNTLQHVGQTEDTALLQSIQLFWTADLITAAKERRS